MLETWFLTVFRLTNSCPASPGCSSAPPPVVIKPSSRSVRVPECAGAAGLGDGKETHTRLATPARKTASRLLPLLFMFTTCQYLSFEKVAF